MLKIKRVEAKTPTLDKDFCQVREACVWGEADSSAEAWGGVSGSFPPAPGYHRTRADLKWDCYRHTFEATLVDTETPRQTQTEIILRDVREVVSWERVPVYGDDGKPLYVEHRLVVRTGA